MKKSLIALLVMGVFATPTFAKKPEWAGEGKPTAEQIEAHKEEVRAKGDTDDHVKKHGEKQKDKAKNKYKAKKEHREKKENMGEKGYRGEREHDDDHDEGARKDKRHDQKEKKGRDAHEGDEARGLEKQRIEKLEQEQKELGKGSDTGQESRETRKKWWKFWGD